MIDYIKKLWDKITTYFSPSKENYDYRRKEFTINNSSVTNRNKKKFQITNERNVPIRGEKFNIINRSRPQRCGQCGTEKSFTRVDLTSNALVSV